MYIGDKVKIQPILFGGGQQQNLRSGTDNVPGIAGMAKAAQMMYENLDEDIARLYRLKKLFIEEMSKIDGTQVNAW